MAFRPFLFKDVFNVEHFAVIKCIAIVSVTFGNAAVPVPTLFAFAFLIYFLCAGAYALAVLCGLSFAFS